MKSLHSEIRHIDLRERVIDIFQTGPTVSRGYEEITPNPGQTPYSDRFMAELGIQLSYVTDQSYEGRRLSKLRAEEALINHLYGPMLPVLYEAMNALNNNDKTGVWNALAKLKDYCYGERSEE